MQLCAIFVVCAVVEFFFYCIPPMLYTLYTKEPFIFMNFLLYIFCATYFLCNCVLFLFFFLCVCVCAVLCFLPGFCEICLGLVLTFIIAEQPVIAASLHCY